ncbi:hypothetical protein U1Q18_048525, partial [Sarracenia purpurea var. burkii]
EYSVSKCGSVWGGNEPSVFSPIAGEKGTDDSGLSASSSGDGNSGGGGGGGDDWGLVSLWKFLLMEFDAGIPMSRGAVTDGPSLSPSLDEDALWQMNLRSNETMESGPYPVREGEPDCSYYIRTGLCRFGATCRFNHPPNRKLAIATARIKGEYPERIGQPECQILRQVRVDDVFSKLCLFAAVAVKHAKHIWLSFAAFFLFE